VNLKRERRRKRRRTRSIRSLRRRDKKKKPITRIIWLLKRKMKRLLIKKEDSFKMMCRNQTQL